MSHSFIQTVSLKGVQYEGKGAYVDLNKSRTNIVKLPSGYTGNKAHIVTLCNLLLDASFKGVQELRIYSTCEYALNIIHWAPGWIARGGKTKGGTEPCHWDEVQELHKLSLNFKSIDLYYITASTKEFKDSVRKSQQFAIKEAKKLIFNARHLGVFFPERVEKIEHEYECVDSLTADYLDFARNHF